MKAKTPKLTAKAKFMIDALCEDAMYHGWQRDQGTGNTVGEAEESYTITKAEMEAYVLKLQNENRALKKRLLGAD